MVSFRQKPNLIPMKKIIFFSLFIITLFTSCVRDDDFYEGLSLEQKLHQYDIWYVNKAESRGATIDFLEKSFTISFERGFLLANMNLVDIGNRGGGLGFRIGDYYTTRGIFLEIQYRNNFYLFEVEQIRSNKIVLHDQYSSASYVLEGYRASRFNYNQLFSDNLHLFLQEFEAWEQTGKRGGNANPFDQETYLRFVPERGNQYFDASRSPNGIAISAIRWDYRNTYSVNRNVLGLIFDGTLQEFRIHVVKDNLIELEHLNSGTIYTFQGIGNIIFR